MSAALTTADALPKPLEGALIFGTPEYKAAREEQARRADEKNRSWGRPDPLARAREEAERQAAEAALVAQAVEREAAREARRLAAVEEAAEALPAIHEEYLQARQDAEQALIAAADAVEAAALLRVQKWEPAFSKVSNAGLPVPERIPPYAEPFTGGAITRIRKFGPSA